jgi:hypothetical protein
MKADSPAYCYFIFDSYIFIVVWPKIWFILLIDSIVYCSAYYLLVWEQELQNLSKKAMLYIHSFIIV